MVVWAVDQELWLLPSLTTFIPVSLFNLSHFSGHIFMVLIPVSLRPRMLSIFVCALAIYRSSLWNKCLQKSLAPLRKILVCPFIIECGRGCLWILFNSCLPSRHSLNVFWVLARLFTLLMELIGKQEFQVLMKLSPSYPFFHLRSVFPGP